MCHPPSYYLHLDFLLHTYMLCNWWWYRCIQLWRVLKYKQMSINSPLSSVWFSLQLYACVGSSLGGMLSLMAAAEFPERVGRLVQTRRNCNDIISYEFFIIWKLLVKGNPFNQFWTFLGFAAFYREHVSEKRRLPINIKLGLVFN